MHMHAPTATHGAQPSVSNTTTVDMLPTSGRATSGSQGYTMGALCASGNRAALSPVASGACLLRHELGRQPSAPHMPGLRA